MNPIYLLVTAGILMSSGDLALAAWSREGQMYLLAVGLLLNLCGVFAYANTLGVQNIGMATGISLGLNLLAVTVFGSLFFGQSISAARAAGMFALATSIIFIEVVG